MNQCLKQFKRVTPDDYTGFFSVADLTDLNDTFATIKNAPQLNRIITFVNAELYERFKSMLLELEVNLNDLADVTIAFNNFVSSLPEDLDTRRAMEHDVPFLERVNKLSDLVLGRVMHLTQPLNEIDSILRYQLAKQGCTYAGHPEAIFICSAEMLDVAKERVYRAWSVDEYKYTLRGARSSALSLCSNVVEGESQPMFRRTAPFHLWDELACSANALDKLLTYAAEALDILNKEIFNEQND